jgi:hypothetical protein
MQSMQQHDECYMHEWGCLLDSGAVCLCSVGQCLMNVWLGLKDQGTPSHTCLAVMCVSEPVHTKLIDQF